MTYQLTFFCRSGEESAGDAMDRLLDRLLEDGTGLVGEWTGPYEDEVAVFRLGTPRKDCADRPAGDLLALELRVGVAAIAESVIAASPQDEQGIWGCDLLADVTLSGEHPDWALVDRIWAALSGLWQAVPWDETSGFAVAGGGREASASASSEVRPPTHLHILPRDPA